MSAPKRNKPEGILHSLTGKNIVQGVRVVVLILFFVACIAIAVPVGVRVDFPSVLVVPVSVLLLISMAVKVFAVKDFYHKLFWYVLDSVLLIAFNVFSGWDIASVVRQPSYAYLAYVCVLSEFYLSAPRLRDGAVMFAVNLAAYTAVYIVNAVLAGELSNAFDISSQYFVALVVLVLHFIMFSFAMELSRKNRQIEESMRALEENRNELMRAYERVEEAVAVEERNRIAKEIHDTAGHSLTTVIMQTEAAKLSIRKDPAEAERCISAANLQAKNCLNELRLSVHLLSGRRENCTFREYLEGILEESCTGTGLTVRSHIDEVELSPEAERFVAGVLREGISNGVRHGGSTAFFFECKDMGNYIEVLLSDNGSGCARFKEGFGLSGMRAKAESLGGMVNFSSAPGEGFEIRLSLPAGCKRKGHAEEGGGTKKQAGKEKGQ